jgi:hypothetical protein
MSRVLVSFVSLLLFAGGVGAEEPAAPKGDKVMSGMSVLGNDDAPKSLVIVPWKSSVLGDTLDVSRGLDAARGPVDKDVFTRELNYYEIRSAAGAARSGAQ